MKQRKFGTAIKTLAAITLLSAGSTAMAASCGNGTVLEIKEGGWNTNDLFISVQGEPDAAVDGTLWVNTWVRYRANLLDPERMRAIRSLAYLAFSGGYSISTNTHNSDCSSATEIGIQ
jgi:hypothetical protein